MVRCGPYPTAGPKGPLRSSRADRGAQVLPPAGATVPPWLPAKSARVSNLPACCALGPPACAAPCSCHHETCSARSAWLRPGKACPFRSEEHTSELQSLTNLVCRLLLEKKKNKHMNYVLT